MLLHVPRRAGVRTGRPRRCWTPPSQALLPPLPISPTAQPGIHAAPATRHCAYQDAQDGSEVSRALLVGSGDKRFYSMRTMELIRNILGTR